MVKGGTTQSPIKQSSHIYHASYNSCQSPKKERFEGCDTVCTLLRERPLSY